ncbi:Flagellar protein FliS [compost metagenome]
MARGDIAQKCLLIGKAIDIITGLRQGLDEEKAEDPAAIQQLDSLYEYMNSQLLKANVNSDPEIIDEVVRLLTTLKSGWDEIAPVGL